MTGSVVGQPCSSAKQERRHSSIVCSPVHGDTGPAAACRVSLSGKGCGPIRDMQCQAKANPVSAKLLPSYRAGAHAPSYRPRVQSLRHAQASHRRRRIIQADYGTMMPPPPAVLLDQCTCGVSRRCTQDTWQGGLDGPVTCCCDHQLSAHTQTLVLEAFAQRRTRTPYHQGTRGSLARQMQRCGSCCTPVH